MATLNSTIQVEPLVEKLEITDRTVALVYQNPGRMTPEFQETIRRNLKEIFSQYNLPILILDGGADLKAIEDLRGPSEAKPEKPTPPPIQLRKECGLVHWF